MGFRKAKAESCQQGQFHFISVLRSQRFIKQLSDEGDAVTLSVSEIPEELRCGYKLLSIKPDAQFRDLLFFCFR